MSVRGDQRRWVALAIGSGAMTAGCAFQFGMPYLIPALRAEGVSLERAAVIVACPMAGLLCTLIAWGAAADRWGERLVLSAGLSVAGAALLGAAGAHGTVALGGWLAVAGAGGGSVHAASGRLILGWFAAHERGLAMGARQTAQPLGVAVAALVLPPLSTGGPGPPLVALAAGCLLMAVLVVLFVRDPAHAAHAGARTGAPYRTPVLYRIHAASALLVVPQFAVATFALVYLVDAHGWAAATAGRLLAVVQVGGALARLGAGVWSDRVASRLRPMRLLAGLIGAVMLALAIGAYAESGAAVAVLLIAGVVTVSTNGLAYTAVAEYAGRSWAGRALGVQNTGQNLLAVATPPVLAQLVGGAGYPAAFAAVIAFPLVAAALIPVAAETG
ncbi:MAG TPA: MFS transporter [Streptosporangiaceae bacterium]|nr:MFS transporter [Streptosporangiaceae bacterium]